MAPWYLGGDIKLMAFLISGFISLTIYFFIRMVFDTTKGNLKFIDLARDDGGYPSLASSQTLAWTILIVFCFTVVTTIRILDGTAGSMIGNVDIPSNLLALLGINLAVTPISGAITKQKYGKTVKKGTTHEFFKGKPWGGMLLEDKRPSITRFQMFGWTVVSLLLYSLHFVVSVGSYQLGAPGDVYLILPDIAGTMVILMGISQGTYIGGKLVSPTKPTIIGVAPKEVQIDGQITVIGHNFDPSSKVYLNNRLIKEDSDGPDKLSIEPNLISFNVGDAFNPDKFTVEVLVGTDSVIYDYKKQDDDPKNTGL